MGRKEQLEALNTPIDGKRFVFTLQHGSEAAYTLKYAPDGWADDEYKLVRDMKFYGVFRKFTAAEMKFVKDGRDFVKDAYDTDGINALVSFTVTEYNTFGQSRVRFLGRLDYSTYKLTELSADIQVIDGAFTDILLNRWNSEINLFAAKDSDGNALSALTTQYINMPEINIRQVANWSGYDYTTVYNGLHYMFMRVVNSEYDEAFNVEAYGFNFFRVAAEEYTSANLNLKLQATLNGNNSSARFTWNYYISRWVGGTETVIYTGSVQGLGSYPLAVDIDLTEVITINVGDSLSLRGDITNTVGTGTIQFSNIELNLATQIESIIGRELYMVQIHEAFERIVANYTGLTGRFKSDFFGRTDIGYDVDGELLAITTGRYIRNNFGLNNTMPVSGEKLFDTVKAIFNVGMGIEVIDGVEKLVIEPMSYFLSDSVVLNVSDRIASETIIREVYPELIFNRISVGFNSYEYRSLGGVYEYNTTSKYTNIIKPVDRELNAVAPYRADMSGVIALLTEPAENKDVSGESDIFLFDIVRDGSDYLIQTTEGFDQAEDFGGRDTLFNVRLSPARNIRRHGSFIRGFIDKYLSSSLQWQTADKNTKLRSTETGQSEIIENADIAVNTLDTPFWVAETMQFEVPALETDIEVIQANPYGLIQCSDTEYGYLLDYTSKNENGKSEYLLLKCNTAYVTPEGDPIYPTRLTIKKLVNNAVYDMTVFKVDIVGDNGISYIGVPFSMVGFAVLESIPYGTYTISEHTETGYTLVGYTPGTEIVIDADNLRVDVIIENVKLEELKYGALYNWYAATDAREITSSGWEIPTQAQIETLRDYVGGFTVAGGKLKETGTDYWNTPNEGAENAYQFNARGIGSRAALGAFLNLKNVMNILSKTVIGGTSHYLLSISTSVASTSNIASPKYYGNAIRLIKTTTTLTHGQTGLYTGNDGKVYRTICIGTQEWVADNLNETKYRNGDVIPIVTDATAWAALSTGARCSYNNDDSNL